MNTFYKTLITLLYFTNIINVFGQEITYSMCSIHTVKSQNDNFFLKTFPFDNIEQTSTGRTIVFNSDSTKIYEVDRYFELSNNEKEIFLSNNGKYIAYVINREFEWNRVKNTSIEIFDNGILIKQFELKDLIVCNPSYEDCYLFYKEAIDSVIRENGKRKIIFKENAKEFEKQLTQKATFLNNDTVYIFTKTEKLLKVDFNTRNISISPISEVNYDNFMQIKQFHSNKLLFKSPVLYGLPKLSSGLSLEKVLAENFDMVIFPSDKKNSFKFKKFHISIEVIIDKNGNAVLDKINNYTKFSDEKIKKFIENQKFEINSIPSEVEKWRFDGWIVLMNKSKKVAKKEKKQELIEEKEAYIKRIVADSINGLYIPKNIEECFLELNKLVKPKDIEAIKNFKDRNETIALHHGFGTWLRNNWGFWRGSRLQKYLIMRGVKHPDEMSSIILLFYYDWLHESHEEWKKFDSQLN
jgi:hypothetical protein